MIVDAGIGLPSHACKVMEWGFDGVLLSRVQLIGSEWPVPSLMRSEPVGALSSLDP